VLAVTVFSPAGLGGMIGTSVASGFGLDSSKPNADDPYANLPAYPAPLTQHELSDIRGQLARTAASLEITRAATEAKIEHVRSIALTDGLVTFAQARVTAPAANALSLAAATEPTPTPAAAPIEAVTPVSYSGGGAADSSPHDNDERHLELAELLLAHETF
jgi:hypothetical protein